MVLPTELRRRAEQCRQLAKIATTGGDSAYRTLRTLADEFDRQAADLERLVAFEEANRR